MNKDIGIYENIFEATLLGNKISNKKARLHLVGIDKWGLKEATMIPIPVGKKYPRCYDMLAKSVAKFMGLPLLKSQTVELGCRVTAWIIYERHNDSPICSISTVLSDLIDKLEAHISHRRRAERRINNLAYRGKRAKVKTVSFYATASKIREEFVDFIDSALNTALDSNTNLYTSTLNSPEYIEWVLSYSSRVNTYNKKITKLLHVPKPISK